MLKILEQKFDNTFNDFYKRAGIDCKIIIGDSKWIAVDFLSVEKKLFTNR